ncbi:MAG: RNA ligase (ATP) [Nitrospirae bacterium]|uniref:RNA ligase (ATP) n=1 Tax=Candidatus Magnetobacterium casense TaxID=1455061 RepID=UPI000590CC37|nr:RNA ligase (ATP) [Candidatus Magnetobacterium casensis]MBF0338651.1 RNA ligase (ATP) [Nitrospirota bacterium]
MSSFKCEVVQIRAILPHPNADNLELAMVKDWTVAVKKATYKEGDKVIHVPIDAVLPLELSDKIGITAYLSRQRVRTAKIRGLYSQGLIIDIGIVGADTEIGTDVSAVLGITKYEPPIPADLIGEVRAYDSRFKEYTQIEHIENYAGILAGLDDDVVVTEKVHGVNARFGRFDSDFFVGSHTLSLKESDSNLYWRAFNQYKMREIVQEDMIVYGEIYGSGVQKLNYGLSRDVIGFVVFDICRDSRYLNWNDIVAFCKSTGLAVVPELYRGRWTTDVLKLTGGKTAMAGDNIREGIVIRPETERYDLSAGRVIFKSVNKAFLIKDYGDLR